MSDQKMSMEQASALRQEYSRAEALERDCWKVVKGPREFAPVAMPMGTPR
jgi:hypothetical protein